MIFSRNKIYVLFSAVVVFLSLTAFESNKDTAFQKNFLAYYRDHSFKLNQKITAFAKEINLKNKNTDTSKKLLRDVREEYKSIEGFINYFLPHEQRFLNRAIILEMEKDERVSDMVIPHGFQYLEKMLYSDSVNYLRENMIIEIAEINKVLMRINLVIADYIFNEQNIFEAVQLQIIRQFILGLIGFETPESHHGIRESKAVLNHTKELLQTIIPEAMETDNLKNFLASVDAAVQNLGEMNDKEEKDFFTFYSKYYISLSKNFVKVHEQIVGNIRKNASPVNMKAGSIFEATAFNTFNFIQSKNFKERKNVVELGRILFFDPVLSDNNERACASCHVPKKGFTDGLGQSLAFDQDNSLQRNAPTIINSVFQKSLFVDGRSTTFEDQAFRVLSNPQEMHHDFSIVAEKIKSSPEYDALFDDAFKDTRDTIIDSRSVLAAISEYERTLVGLNSRFDQAMNGDYSKLDKDEKAGFNLFVGKGNCASCHFLPLFNGTMPPEYLETEWETLGVPAIDKHGNKTLDPDSGRGGIVMAEILRHAFKTPTVRNAEITGPYMHNGVFKTLEEVIDFYDVGGGAGMGLDVPFQTLSADSLKLSKLEKSQLVLFLKSLTDTTGLTSVPNFLPAFPGNDKLNKRSIGGNY